MRHARRRAEARLGHLFSQAASRFTHAAEGFTAAQRRGLLQSSTMLTRRMRMESLEPRLLLSADLTPISASLDVPGESDVYVFSLTEKKRINFDALTQNGNIRWSLAGPNGQIVTNRSFLNSDSYDIGGANIFDLEVGEYRLTIDGVGDTTGTYAFRLLDLVNAAKLTPGTRVDGTIEGKETDLYQFDVQAGDRLFFDRLGLSGSNPSWRLVAPDGSLVFGPNGFDDIDTLTLGQTGTYTLMMEGRIYDGPASYSFNIQPVADRSKAMTVGDTVNGRIDHAGQTVRHSFSLSEIKTLFFD